MRWLGDADAEVEIMKGKDARAQAKIMGTSPSSVSVMRIGTPGRRSARDFILKEMPRPVRVYGPIGEL